MSFTVTRPSLPNFLMCSLRTSVILLVSSQPVVTMSSVTLHENSSTKRDLEKLHEENQLLTLNDVPPFLQEKAVHEICSLNTLYTLSSPNCPISKAKAAISFHVCRSSETPRSSRQLFRGRPRHRPPSMRGPMCRCFCSLFRLS